MVSSYFVENLSKFIRICKDLGIDSFTQLYFEESRGDSIVWNEPTNPFW